MYTLLISLHAHDTDEENSGHEDKTENFRRYEVPDGLVICTYRSWANNKGTKMKLTIHQYTVS